MLLINNITMNKINGSSYFIEDNDNKNRIYRFYTPDGDIIKEINDDPNNDNSYNSNNPIIISKLLDAKYIDQFRPIKVIFANVGRTVHVSFVDKNDNVVISSTYHGKLNKLDYIRYLIEECMEPIYQLDYKWLLGDDIKFINNVYKKKNSSGGIGSSCTIQ